MERPFAQGGPQCSQVEESKWGLLPITVRRLSFRAEMVAEQNLGPWVLFFLCPPASCHSLRDAPLAPGGQAPGAEGHEVLQEAGQFKAPIDQCSHQYSVS